MFDLLIKDGRLFDVEGRELVSQDVGIKEGKISKVGEIGEGEAHRVLRLHGELVTPGMIDLHTHVMKGVTPLGVDPDSQLSRGVTTVVDAGSLGPGNFQAYYLVTSRSRTRVVPFLNIAYAGIPFFFRTRKQLPDAPSSRALNVPEAARVVSENKVVRGIKVRIGSLASGRLGLKPLKAALELASRFDLPVMCHIDNPPPDVGEVLKLLRKGDILTHSFRGGGNSLELHWEQAREARRRGVIFDVGHGMHGLSFSAAKALIEGGFPPDIISTDLHLRSLRIARNLPWVMSEFLTLGMTLEQVLSAVTHNPSRVLGIKSGVGEGTEADLAILALRESKVVFRDGEGKEMASTYYLRIKASLISGSVVDPPRV
jgi:dihydroorotase